MKLERYGEFRVLTLRETGLEGYNATGETPENIADYYRTVIATDPRHNADVETLIGITLSTRRKITGYYVVATGTLDTLLCHPREVFRPAIVANAAAIVVLHNHPSGDYSPSEADIKVTRELIRAGQLLRVELLDHVIMGAATPERPKGFCSLRELGYFFE